MKIVWGLLGTLCWTTAARAMPVVVQVLAPDGAPVAGAEVRTERRPDVDQYAAFLGVGEPLRQSARTDAQGVARFDWPASQFGIAAGTTSEFLGTATIWATGLGATNLTLVSGDNRVKLARAGVARGLVRDEKGAPLAGASVRAWRIFDVSDDRSFMDTGKLSVAADEAAFRSVSDAQGRWQIGNLPLGARVQVQLEGAPNAAANANAPIVDGESLLTQNLVSDTRVLGGAGEGGELYARAAATLTGRVVDAQGEPVAKVTVWARALTNQMEAYLAPKTVSTDAQGEFRVERLEAGSYKIVLFPPHALPGVAAGASAIANLANGQTLALPVQKLIAGGTIVLQFSDGETGQPLAQVGALAKPTGTYDPESFVSGSSDEKGTLRLNVAPGTYRAQAYQTPVGYVRLDALAETITVAQGQTQTIAVKLQKGALVTGRVVDSNGKIVADTTFNLSTEAAELSGSGPVTSDSKGAWKTQQLAPGSYKVEFNQNENWELVGPKTVEIPSKNPLKIKLKPLAQTQFVGRVVDSAGQGIAGAQVNAKITLPTADYFFAVERNIVSDAQGNYTLPEFPTTARRIVISATRAGYALEKAPAIKNEKHVWSATDAVLQALSAHVGGTVVDTKDQPQNGVQVLAPRYETMATSDDKGAWKFRALVPGETEIVAVGAAGASVQTVSTGRDDTPVKLQPFRPSAPSDIDGAIAVLDDAWQTSRGRDFYRRDGLPATLAPYDPDAALAMARDGEAKVSEAALLQIVQVLAKFNPERAREWTPQVLAGLQEPNNQFSAAVMMARALVDAHPDEAKTYFQRSVALYDGLKDQRQKRGAVSSLAVLSAKLQLPEAPKWFERTLETLNDKANASPDYATAVWRLGAVNADWAEQIVDADIKAAPDSKSYSQSPVTVAAASIRRVATWDLPSAQRLLDKYGALKSEYDFIDQLDPARAAIVVETFRKNQDVEAALASARTLTTTKIPALSQIAALAPSERRGEILRSALADARVNSYQKSSAIRIAYQLLPYDRAAARQALDEIRLTFDSYTDDMDRYSRADDISWWAYAYRDIDAAQARWLLEREWARVNNLTPDPGNAWETQRGTQLANLILAMATIDMPRAQQLIFSLPLNDNNTLAFSSAQVLARWMLASETERQARAFDRWGDNDNSEGLYSSGW